MRIRIDDITKGTFRLPTPIDNQDGTLKIGIKSIGCWVGFYNIYEEQTCRSGRQGEDSKVFKIKPGLYTFKEMSRMLRKKVEGLNLSLDKISGLVELSVPQGVDVWLTEPVRYMLGLDDNEWLQGENIGDYPVEFLPANGISIYLNELSTSNLSTYSKPKLINSEPPERPQPGSVPDNPKPKSVATQTSEGLVISNLLSNIPILSENFGQYFTIQFDNPLFLDLEAKLINQLEFSTKIHWRNHVQDSLDNHSLPISLEVEIK